MSVMAERKHQLHVKMLVTHWEIQSDGAGIHHNLLRMVLTIFSPRRLKVFNHYGIGYVRTGLGRSLA